MKKPFDVLAEGLIAKKDRGDWTPLELFIAGVRGWEAGLRRLMGDGKLDKCRPCVRSEEVEEQDPANRAEPGHFECSMD